jgi:uncharacterized repeat protein (TIGR03803 family)
MSRNKRLGTLGAVLLVFIAAILVVPGAGAQSKYQRLYRFTGVADGDYPFGVIFDQAGNLYGTAGKGGDGPCDGGCGQVYKLTPNSDGKWTKSVLYSFCSLTNCGDGFYPFAGLIFDQAGNLYGTTYLGGGPVGCDCGVVFELTRNADGSWAEKVLHHFTSGADGGLPIGGLIFDQAGNLYGATYASTGYGAVFQLIPNMDGSWTEKVLHSFPLDHRAGGAGPLGGVIFDHAGNLYGTTLFGGDTSCGSGAGCGVVFQLTPSADGGWREKVLHHFTDGTGGGFPGAGLIFDQPGNLYGTTESGGNLSQCTGFGCGVVFELTPNEDGSWKEKVLHRFTGGADGGLPEAALTFDQAGNLYSTTYFGGNLNYCILNGTHGCGVVFKLTPNSKGGWSEKVLHYFVHNPGTHPVSSVVFDAVKNLYGTTQGDDTTTFGSVFEITP